MPNKSGLRVPTPDEKEAALQRAVRVLKGSETEPTLLALAARANVYLPRDTIITIGEMHHYASSLSNEKRIAIGLPLHQAPRKGRGRAA